LLVHLRHNLTPLIVAVLAQSPKRGGLFLMTDPIDEGTGLAIRVFDRPVDQPDFLKADGAIPLFPMQGRKQGLGCLSPPCSGLNPIAVKGNPPNLAFNPIRFHFTRLHLLDKLKGVLPRHPTEMVRKCISQGGIVRLQQYLLAGINTLPFRRRNDALTYPHPCLPTVICYRTGTLFNLNLNPDFVVASHFFPPAPFAGHITLIANIF
jgi:hypothetical protein